MEGDDADFWTYTWRNYISTHALRMEGDTYKAKNSSEEYQFLPTPSAWSACPGAGDPVISTHALRMEGDQEGEALWKWKYDEFRPTPSAWRATRPAGAEKMH